MGPGQSATWNITAGQKYTLCDDERLSILRTLRNGGLAELTTAWRRDRSDQNTCVAQAIGAPYFRRKLLISFQASLRWAPSSSSPIWSSSIPSQPLIPTYGGL
jgi:hypothetical protein